MINRPWSRRALLRGLGGAAIALPQLECMPAARAGTPDAGRLLVVFGGFSTGVDGHTGANLVVPASSSFSLTDVTQPLAAVQSHVSLVSGLSIPVGAVDQPMPPGGRFGGVDSFHHHVNPLLTGAAQVGGGFTTTVTSPSIDQIAAEHLGVGARFPSLTLQAQPMAYADQTAEKRTPSFRSGPGGVSPVQAVTNPRVLFRNLTSVLMPEDGLAAAERTDAVARRLSALDLVDRSMGGLVQKLGRRDQLRLKEHLAHVRALELRLDADPIPEGGSCTSGAEPAVTPVDADLQWSGEVGRSQQMVELIRLAFACDLTRVVALMVTPFQSELNLQPAFGSPHSFHGAHHSGQPSDVEGALRWHIQLFADLVSDLATPDATGAIPLDDTAAVFIMEGGFSRSPQLIDGSGGDSHSTEHMAMLVAGRAGGLRPGRHMAAPGVHPGRVLLTAARATGVPITQFGDLTGELPELF